MSTLEDTVNGMQRHIQDQVTEEVNTATATLHKDYKFLERKYDIMKVQLDSLANRDIQADIDSRSVIIKNLVCENEDNLVQEVGDLFVETLEVSVIVEEVIRFKSYNDRAAPVKVTPRSVDNCADILSAKSSLMDNEKTKKIRIEGCFPKAEVIARQNWNTLIGLLGNKGKSVRLLGGGRIIRNNEEPGDMGQSSDSRRRPGKGSQTGGTKQGHPAAEHSPEHAKSQGDKRRRNAIARINMELKTHQKAAREQFRLPCRGRRRHHSIERRIVQALDTRLTKEGPQQ